MLTAAMTNKPPNQVSEVKQFLSSFIPFGMQWDVALKDVWPKKNNEIINFFNRLKFSKNKKDMMTVDDKFKISLVNFITKQEDDEFGKENNIFTQTGIYVQNIEKRKYVLKSKGGNEPSPITDSINKKERTRISDFFPNPKTA